MANGLPLCAWCQQACRTCTTLLCSQATNSHRQVQAPLAAIHLGCGTLSDCVCAWPLSASLSTELSLGELPDFSVVALPACKKYILCQIPSSQYGGYILAVRRDYLPHLACIKSAYPPPPTCSVWYLSLPAYTRIPTYLVLPSQPRPRTSSSVGHLYRHSSSPFFPPFLLFSRLRRHRAV